MTSSTTVNPGEFTSEQKEYLHGFFTSIAQRGLPFVSHTPDRLITADPESGLPNLADVQAEATWFNTPVSDLSREERWKYEQDPLAIWDKILEYSNRNTPPTDDDRFRLKYHGLFYVAPAQNSFMLRLRVPGGILSAHQDRKIYVQDRMLEQASTFWRWLQDGASVYVCGDASRMAKDVDATLGIIAEHQGHLTHEAAIDYIRQLRHQHRYHRDVY